LSGRHSSHPAPATGKSPLPERILGVSARFASWTAAALCRFFATPRQFKAKRPPTPRDRPKRQLRSAPQPHSKTLSRSPEHRFFSRGVPPFNFPRRPGAGPAAKPVPADSRSRERTCPGCPAQHSSPSADPNPCQQTFQASPQFGNLDSEPRHGLLARSHWALPLGEVGPQRYLRPRTAPDSHHHPERMIPCPSSAPHRPSLP
jgi:hypothetical protein